MRYVLVLLAAVAVAVAAPLSYHVVKTIHLGGEGGWDLFALDAGAHRLYLPRGTQVMVVDTASGKLVGDISGLPGAHAVALAPSLGRGFTSDGRANTSTIFSLKTLKPLGTVNVGEGPDAIIYDPATKRVFTFNGGSNDATAFDAATGKVAGTVALEGKPELPAADGHGHIYANLESTSEVVEIDSRALKVTRRFSLAPGEDPTGIGLDVAEHLVFSVCANKIMTVLDTRSGKIIATVPIGQGPDGAGYDPGTKLAFASCGEGVLTVVRETSPGKFAVAKTVATQRGARTMVIDPKTHRIYLPTAKFGPMPAAEAGQRRRPPMIPDTFGVLVVGR